VTWPAGIAAVGILADRGRLRLWRWWRPATVGALVVLWAKTIQVLYVAFGLFIWLGVDFRHLYSQARVLSSGRPWAIYDRDAVAQVGQALAVYAHDPVLNRRDPVWVMEPGVVPYPPVFAWLFAPFTLPPPPIGFALWTGLNLLATLYLGARMATLFPKGERRWVVPLLLVSFPVVYTFMLGQPMMLLACAVAECYLSLRAGHDLSAGLWLSVLLFKPQYGILLGPLLLWKRRWRAVTGVAAGGVVILAASVLLVGVEALRAFPSALMGMSDFRGGGGTYPGNMINWRKVILTAQEWLGPRLSDQSAVLLTVLLGVATAGCALAAWRGPWSPREPRFAVRMSLLLLATVLANYHSHVYGAVLLAMPVADMFAGGRPRLLTRVSILAAAALPPVLILFLPLTYTLVLTLLLFVCFGALLAESWPPGSEPGGAVQPILAAPRPGTHNRDAAYAQPIPDPGAVKLAGGD
jgi:hypothetical protein